MVPIVPFKCGLDLTPFISTTIPTVSDAPCTGRIPTREGDPGFDAMFGVGPGVPCGVLLAPLAPSTIIGGDDDIVNGRLVSEAGKRETTIWVWKSIFEICEIHIILCG